MPNERLTDAEVIATWMVSHGDESSGEWWVRHTTKGHMFPMALTLDKLWLVEERLSDGQWGAYGLALAETLQSPERHFARGLIHAAAAQKIAAIASVLRAEVEALLCGRDLASALANPFDRCAECGREVTDHEKHGTDADPCAVRPVQRPFTEEAGRK